MTPNGSSTCLSQPNPISLQSQNLERGKGLLCLTHSLINLAKREVHFLCCQCNESPFHLNISQCKYQKEFQDSSGIVFSFVKQVPLISSVVANHNLLLPPLVLADCVGGCLLPCLSVWNVLPQYRAFKIMSFFFLPVYLEDRLLCCCWRLPLVPSF